MSLLKYIAIGAAVAYGVNYITKKRADGKSIYDDLAEQAPDLMNKVKEYSAQAVEEVKQRTQQAKESF